MSQIKSIKLNTDYNAPSAEYAIVHFGAAVLFQTAFIMVFNVPSPLEKSYIPLFYAAGIVGILISSVLDFVSKKLAPKFSYSYLLRFIPLLILILYIALTGPAAHFGGFEAYINVLIAGYNRMHDGGIDLFNIETSFYNIGLFSLGVAFTSGYVSYLLIGKNRIFAACIIGILLLFTELLTDTFSIYGTALYISAVLGSWMSPESNQTMNRQSKLLWALFTVLFVSAAAVSSKKNLEAIDTARTDIYNAIHKARYGEDRLPLGKLSDAYKLDSDNDDTLMLIHTDQEKQLYLKGFTGSVYSDGKWKRLGNSAYGGAYSGMLKWLRSQGFDPMTQSARYYELTASALSDADAAKPADDEAANSLSIPAENQVTVNIENASRYPLYVPSSLSLLTGAREHEVTDQEILSGGITGDRIYSYTEYSDSRPNELTVGAGWLTDPSTDEQAAYCEAESVYREFVYDTYTAVSDKARAAVDQIFWKDYDDRGSGIYSALSHIRRVLENGYSYDKSTGPSPDSDDELLYFLRDSHRGNSCLYSSAAVEALRAYGIPARYVEGYYISAADIAAGDDGNVQVSGDNAHAWVEIYFDGIGWLPADVTPGYYYDAISLQQIISLPDAVHKTAALDDSDLGAESVASPDASSSALDNLKKLSGEVAYNVYKLLKGAVAALLIMLVRLIIIIELIRAAALIWLKLRYDRADEEKRSAIIAPLIFRILKVRGYDAHLGWNTGELDDKLCSSIDDIEEGEFERVNTLIEKSIYGEEALKPFELRTLSSFLIKIASAYKSDPMILKLKLRYMWLIKSRKAHSKDRSYI